MAALIVASVLAALLGFAAHRASVCTVRAVAEITSARTAYMLASIGKSALWVMAVIVPALLLTPAALDLLVAAEQRKRLKTCLGELEERHSSVIRSAFLDGVTYEQLAQRMNVPLGTMKSWIRRGLMKLRTCLER